MMLRDYAMRALMIRVILAGTIGLAPLPASATQTGRPASAETSDRSIAILASRLAAILNSEEIAIGGASTDETAKQFGAQVFGSKEDLAAMEAQFPGITDQIFDTIMPIVNRSLRARLPELQRRQASLYAETFTAAELEYLITFYESSTGRKLLTLMMANMQTENMLKSAQASDEMSVSTDSVLADIQATARKLVPQFDDAEQAILIKLATSSAAPKMQKMAPRTQQIGLDWYNESTPGEEAEILAAIEAIYARYEKTLK